MMRYMRFVLLGITMLAAVPAQARRYNPFVWATYRECSSIYSIAMNMQEVYFATDGGILRFDRLQNRWLPPVTGSNGFPGKKAELVAVDKTFNKLWVLSEQALSVYVPSISHWETEIARTSLPARTIHSIGFTQDSVYIAGNGAIYAALRGSLSWHRRTGTLPQGIAWYGEKAGISLNDYPFLTPYYATDPFFNKYAYTAAAIDNKDMWLGTDGYGVFHFNTFTWNGTHYLPGIANNRVEALFRDEEGFWIGGSYGTGKGFSHIDFSTGVGEHFRAEDIYGIISDNVHAITGNERTVWFGTNEGLLRYEKEQDLWKTYTISNGLPGSNVLSLQLKADTLFVGTDDGLGMLTPGRTEMVTMDEFDHVPITAFGLHDGRLLIGTDRGVFMRTDTSFDVIGDPDGDLGFGVSAIFTDSAALWFGTLRRGIDVYMPDSLSWHEFLPRTTFSGEYVFAIAGDRDFVWIGSEFGISRYSRKTDSWQTFTEDDGLAHNEVHAIYVDSEFVWFGTRDGVTRLRFRDPSVPQ